MNADQAAPSGARTAARLSDSPWFYAACFCGMGLIALWAASGKYARRQAAVESRYRAEQYALTDRQPTGGEKRPGTPPETIVPLRPIAVPLAAGLIASIGVLLWRAARNGRQGAVSPPRVAPRAKGPA